MEECPPRLTPESFAALALEHLRLLDLALSAVLAGVGLARVVPALAHSAPEEAVAAVLLQVEHAVVDVQHADAAHQACADPRPRSHAGEQNARRDLSGQQRGDQSVK